MQKWEYKVFASHVDPAELVVILDESGREGWELVTIAPVTDYHPPELLQHAAIVGAAPLPDLDADEVEDVVPVEAFRYIFKRPLE
jgi:hypothetical protein